MSLKSNTTDSENPEVVDPLALIPVYVIWLSEFVIIGGGNLLIAVSIVRYKALRNCKEYVIICGLSFADAWNLCGYGTAGIYRLGLIYRDQFNTLRSSWHCSIIPPTVFWLMGESVAACMLVIVSLDRLLAVSIPLRYMKLSATYALYLALAAFGLCGANTLLGLVFAFLARNDGKYIDAPCFTGPVWMANNVVHAYITMYSAPFFCILSIVLYCAVGITFWHTSKSVAPATNDSQKRKESQRQRRLTITLGICSICTLIFNAIPVVIAYAGEQGFIDLPRLVTQILWLLPNLNPACNFVIYYKRQPDIVKGIKALLSCKEMPMSVNMWRDDSKPHVSERTPTPSVRETGM